MDISITKKRLNDHLSYDWWKYLAILVASIFFWSLVFTMSAPRLAISKKLEIFFIINGYNTDKAEELRNRLKGSLSSEIVEMGFYSYTEGDSVTSQVLYARTSVREGDLYAFGYSDEPANNSFGGYVDNGLFADFKSVIDGALQYGSSVISFENFKASNTDKKLNTEEKLKAEYNLYLKRCQRALAEAEKLSGYIDLYPQLFLNYARFTVAKNTIKETGDYTVQEPKIWGLDFNAFKGNITNLNLYGFIQDTRGINTETGEAYPLQYALGIVSFKEDNMPLYYENLAVINYFIDTYYLDL